MELESAILQLSNGIKISAKRNWEVPALWQKTPVIGNISHTFHIHKLQALFQNVTNEPTLGQIPIYTGGI